MDSADRPDMRFSRLIASSRTVATAAFLVAGVVLPPTGLFGCKEYNVTVNETPIKLVEDHPGRGRTATAGDVVTIDYEMRLPDGERLLGEEDFRFTVGEGAVIAAVDEAVLGMREGGRRIAACPPHKHWGSAGYGDGAIPPHTDLTLHVELKDVD
jgi:peptidylprolyl isomerase